MNDPHDKDDARDRTVRAGPPLALLALAPAALPALVAVGALWHSPLTALPLLVSAVGVAALIVLRFRAGIIEVNARGMSWGVGLRRRRVPWAEIRSVTMDPRKETVTLFVGTDVRARPLPLAELDSEGRDRIVEAIRTHRPVREHVELAMARAVPDRLLPLPVPWSTVGVGAQRPILMLVVVPLVLFGVGVLATHRLGGRDNAVLAAVVLSWFPLIPLRLLFRPLALRPNGVVLRRLPFFTWRLLPWKDILTVRGGGPRRRLRFLLRDGTACETFAELTTLEFHRLQITVQQRQLATVFE